MPFKFRPTTLTTAAGKFWIKEVYLVNNGLGVPFYVGDFSYNLSGERIDARFVLFPDPEESYVPDYSVNPYCAVILSKPLFGNGQKGNWWYNAVVRDAVVEHDRQFKEINP